MSLYGAGVVERAAQGYERRRRLTALLALPLSVLGHGLLALVFVGLSSLGASPRPPRKPKPRAVSMRALDARHYARNRGPSAPALQAPEPPRPQGQVVDVAPGNERLAPDAKYLAETNNRVAKETRAREQVARYSRATAKPTPKPEEAPSALGRAPSLAAASVPREGLTGLLGGRSLVSELFQQATAGRVSEAPPEKGPVGTEAGSEAGAPGDTSEGGGAPNDDLRDVATGDGTFLNTREWKYAGFLNRVKQAVSAKWDPNRRLRGLGIGLQDRVTVLNVTLRADGSLAGC